MTKPELNVLHKMALQNLLISTFFLNPIPIKLKTAKAALQNILLHLEEISSIKKIKKIKKQTQNY